VQRQSEIASSVGESTAGSIAYGLRGVAIAAPSALRRCGHSCGILPSVRHYFLEIAQEGRARNGALDEDAAPKKLRLSTHKIEFGETIERTSDRWLRHVEFRSQSTNCLCFILQVAGREQPSWRAEKSGPLRAGGRQVPPDNFRAAGARPLASGKTHSQDIEQRVALRLP
jgi:hypothetical protein